MLEGGVQEASSGGIKMISRELGCKCDPLFISFTWIWDRANKVVLNNLSKN